uniref:Uncharacterized protein n=1 Tax=Ananas comosus var. bracteatus TaxID=296719 RepID=A0A6V7QM86_ANACO|nr:unnamed protein product [Ananas comosus var. bracteatus]
MYKSNSCDEFAENDFLAGDRKTHVVVEPELLFGAPKQGLELGVERYEMGMMNLLRCSPRTPQSGLWVRLGGAYRLLLLLLAFYLSLNTSLVSASELCLVGACWRSTSLWPLEACNKK